MSFQIDKKPSNTAVSKEIFDKKVLHIHAARSNRDDFLVHEAEQIMRDKLDVIKKTFTSVRKLSRYDESVNTAENTANAYDLVQSTLSMHWVNDVLGLLRQINFSLMPDGFFIANFFGGECLKELKFCFSSADPNSISPRVSPYITAETAGYLLQNAGFALPVVDTDKIEVSYQNAFALMHHLRKIGETNALKMQRKNFTTKTFMNRVNEIYSEKFSDDEDRITATFEIITMTGWKPHKSQQQALKRGSGEIDLGKILK